MREKINNAATIAANKVAVESIIERMGLSWDLNVNRKACKKAFKKELLSFLSIYDARRIEERTKGNILPEYSISDAHISMLFDNYRMTEETKDILYTFLSTEGIPCYDIQLVADIATKGHGTSGRAKVPYHRGDIIVTPEYGVCKVLNCIKDTITIQPYSAQDGYGISMKYDENYTFPFATDMDLANAGRIENRIRASKFNHYLMGSHVDARPGKFSVFDLVKCTWIADDGKEFYFFSWISSKSNRNGYWNYIVHNPYNSNAEISAPEQALKPASFMEIGQEPIGVPKNMSIMLQYLQFIGGQEDGKN